LATLSERGALLKRGTYVRAVDAAHLDAACGKILATEVRKPDAAFHLVLLELQKTWQETKAARDKATNRETPAPIGKRAPTPMTQLVFASEPTGADDAQRWLDGLPFTRSVEVEDELNRSVKAAAAEQPTNVRDRIRLEVLITLWKRERAKDGVA
jgi:hypothetical protein